MASSRRFLPAALLGACAAGVIVVYAWIGGGAPGELGNIPGRAYYNLLVEGFQAGQLSLHRAAPPGLAQLPDPFDPKANIASRGPLFADDRVHDLSYFRGRLYLYFGVTPAIVLFWPVAALTGHPLSHRHAVIVFAALGFLASTGLIHALWRRYFSMAPIWIVALGVLAAGLATSAPFVLHRPEVWEVAVSCGYALTMLTLLALWRALHDEGKARWLALASLCFGLAVGARPSLLPGAVILLMPVLPALRAGAGRRSPPARLLAGALGPIAAVGIALLAYNYLRFGNALEFGQHYQLAADRQDRVQHFAWSNLWINLRLYFLGTAGWSDVFPFFRAIVEPPLPPGHGASDSPYGLLTNTPFVLLALAVPLAWRSLPDDRAETLRRFVGIATVAFAIPALTMGFFYGSCVRYELEFSPALVLLAVIGLFGAEAALRDRIRLRYLALGAAVVALAYSVAFTSLYGLIRRLNIQCAYATALLGANHNAAAVAALQTAVRLQPSAADVHFMLGVALIRSGDFAAGSAQEAALVRLDPAKSADYAGMLGNELMRVAPPVAALAGLQQLAQAAPRSAAVHYFIGNVLAGQGRTEEAIHSLESAVRLDPTHADAHSRLGFLLAQTRQIDRAVAHLQEAVRLDPTQRDAHLALSEIFSATGHPVEAQAHRDAAARLPSGP